MTPELETALNKIGWEGVKQRSRFFAMRCEIGLTQEGNQFYRSRKEAEKALTYLHDLRQSVTTALLGLQLLPEKHRRFVEQSAHLHAADQAYCRDRIPPAIEALSEIEQAVVMLYRKVHYEVFNQEKREQPRGKKVVAGQVKHKSSGPSKKVAAYDVAETVLEIYVLGTGGQPTAGVCDQHPFVNGAYGRAVAEVFKALGFTMRPYPYCKAAREKYSDYDIKMLQGCMKQEHRTSPSQR